jgi:amino acid transporter
MEGPVALVKSLLVGRPKATAHLEHERITKKLALAVFSSDALSSSAYATEEILLVLIAGGAAALRYAVPISIVITGMLGIVIFSYRQTVHAYPQGGGSYIVARENLGKYPGLVAAAAILTDYVLTVAVSISAGIAAVISAIPELAHARVLMALAVIAVMTLLNLRGIRESAQIFAVPTYAFIVLLGTTIAWGLVKHLVLHRPVPHSPVEPASQALTLYLLLRAFSNGSTALTGVEAIADGVGAFRKPEARNAATTLGAMAVILAFLFVGLTVLARLYGVHGPSEHPHRTVVALVALRVFGTGPLFFCVQAATALILFLAANTAYADFPRLSAILARDRFAPRQLLNRGDRLAFSNGILALGGLAGALVVIYGAQVSRLIHLYVVGVFTAFTLSQAGMVQRWRDNRAREPKWRRYAAVNGVGAAATFIVLCIVIATKFLAGAWIVVMAIPLLVLWFNTVYRHYQSAAVTLRDPARRPAPVRGHDVILLVGWPSEEERRALAYAQVMRPTALRTVHFAMPDDPPGLVTEWGRVLGLAQSLEIVPADGSLARGLRRYVSDVRRRMDASAFLTVIIPERLSPGPVGMLRSRQAFLMKASLLFTPGVVVTDIPYSPARPGESEPPHEITRHVALLLVSGAHNATLYALEYARSLAADVLQVVHVELDPGESAKVLREWEAWSPGIALEIVQSPFRRLAQPIQEYVRGFLADGRTMVTIIIPEFIVQKWWHHLLHNQSPLMLKRTFLYEPNVIVTSVPYRLE